MSQYRDTPMDLADASLVAVAESLPDDQSSGGRGDEGISGELIVEFRLHELRLAGQINSKTGDSQ